MRHTGADTLTPAPDPPRARATKPTPSAARKMPGNPLLIMPPPFSSEHAIPFPRPLPRNHADGKTTCPIYARFSSFCQDISDQSIVKIVISEISFPNDISLPRGRGQGFIVNPSVGASANFFQKSPRCAPALRGERFGFSPFSWLLWRHNFQGILRRRDQGAPRGVDARKIIFRRGTVARWSL